MISELESKFIQVEAYEDEVSKLEKCILGEYSELINSRPGLPSLDDLLDEVYSHNDAVAYSIAELDYKYNYNDYGYDPNEPITDEEYNDRIGEIADGWTEGIYNNYGYGWYLDDCICYILQKNRLAYAFEKHNFMYSDHFRYEDIKAIEIIGNDCQMPLFPEIENEQTGFLTEEYRENIKVFPKVLVE
jgi:hypothetical protein